jgi:MFS superfamily sulfate permease-like transporter
MIAILESYRAGLFVRANLWRNVMAGCIVGVVALPLAMALAIASGARPEQGIYTAIVAGLCTSLFGGTRLQISDIGACRRARCVWDLVGVCGKRAQLIELNSSAPGSRNERP